MLLARVIRLDLRSLSVAAFHISRRCTDPIQPHNASPPPLDRHQDDDYGDDDDDDDEGASPNSHKHFFPYMGFCASIWDNVRHHCHRHHHHHHIQKSKSINTEACLIAH